MLTETAYVASIDGWAPQSTRDGPNARLHWRARNRRVQVVAGLVFASLNVANWPHPLPGEPRSWTITFAVSKPGPFVDDDSQVACLKAVRDAVAHYLGVDDGPTGPRWAYEPWQRGKARVVIRLEREA